MRPKLPVCVCQPLQCGMYCASAVLAISFSDWSVTHSHAGYNPYPAHRLDMYTSGVVIVAKQKAMVVRLHEMFRQACLHATTQTQSQPYQQPKLNVASRLSPYSRRTSGSAESAEHRVSPAGAASGQQWLAMQCLCLEAAETNLSQPVCSQGQDCAEALSGSGHWHPG